MNCMVELIPLWLHWTTLTSVLSTEHKVRFTVILGNHYMVQTCHFTAGELYRSYMISVQCSAWVYIVKRENNLTFTLSEHNKENWDCIVWATPDLQFPGWFGQTCPIFLFTAMKVGFHDAIKCGHCRHRKWKTPCKKPFPSLLLLKLATKISKKLSVR